MPIIKTRLLQRIRLTGAMGVTFLVALAGCSTTPPVIVEPAIESNIATLESQLIAPLAMDWAPRVATTFAPPDVLERRRPALPAVPVVPRSRQHFARQSTIDG